MNEQAVLEQLPGALRAVTGLRVGALEPGPPRTPAMLRAEEHLLAVVARTAATEAQLLVAFRRLRDSAAPGSLPLLVVPHTGGVGEGLCAAAAVNWVDLCGNAVLHAERLHIQVTGRPNRFVRPGRPGSLFSPRASRLARRLLLNPERAFTQHALARVTGLDPGYLSRLVRRYEEEGFVVREGLQPVTVRLGDFDLLLDAWHGEYDFAQHERRCGELPGAGGQARVSELAKGLAKLPLQYAVTGLGAAGFWCPTRFDLVTVYVSTWPEPDGLAATGFIPRERGGNVWLVRPVDAGVFHDAKVLSGVRYVSEVQAYLDLKAHPEPADKIAAAWRE